MLKLSHIRIDKKERKKWKRKKGLENYIPLYPMLRVEQEKLYIGVALTKDTDNIWSNRYR